MNIYYNGAIFSVTFNILQPIVRVCKDSYFIIPLNPKNNICLFLVAESYNSINKGKDIFLKLLKVN